MSYYQRPMGDYKTYGYAGDPGFLSSIFKFGKKVYKALKSKPAQSLITGITAAGAVSQLAAPQALPPMPGTVGGALTFPGGTQIGASYQMGAGAQAMGPGGMMPRGYHYAKDGSGRMVRNRRMNVANPRALRKAMRRVQGFEKLAKRTISFTRRVKMKR